MGSGREPESERTRIKIQVEVWINNQERFTKACKLLKSRMLFWWKRTATRSLNNWIDCRCPHVPEDFVKAEQVVKIESERCK
jgi:hypothetical protein